MHITLIDNTTFTDNAEDLDIVMAIYNLLGYYDNYSITFGSLWNYYRYQMNDDTNESNAANSYRINSKKSFQFQTKIMVSTSANNKALEKNVVAP